MPGMVCTVSVCKNSKQNASKSGKTLSFYRFPKNKIVRQKWIQKCKRGGNWNPKNCRVCSEHFRKDDFERDLKAELLNLTPRKKLKATAIPSLNLTEQVTLPSDGLFKRENEGLVEYILQWPDEDETRRETQDSGFAPEIAHYLVESQTPLDEDKTNRENLLLENEVLRNHLLNMKAQNDELKKKIAALEKVTRNMTSKLVMEEEFIEFIRIE